MTVAEANPAAQEHFFRALTLWQQDQYEAAAGEALMAAQVNGRPFPEAEVLVADCYWRDERFNRLDLIKQLEKVVKLDPGDAGSWLQLAIVARTARDDLFDLAKEQKSVAGHYDADKYFKLSQRAFQEARSHFAAYSRSPAHALSFLFSYNTPLRAGDYIARSDTMPIQQAYDWYQVAADYDIDAILAAMKAGGLYTDEESLSQIRTDIENAKATALRKKVVLSNSAEATRKRNTAVERTVNQKILINVAIAAVVFLLLCWGLYALIT